MNDIDKMLYNYFEGISTLEEEKALRDYFSGAQIDSAHIGYQPLFAAFEEEKRAKAPKPEIPGERNVAARRKPGRKFVAWAFSGAAAAILLLMIASPRNNWPEGKAANVVIINGQRITDPMMAQEYADKKFEEAYKIIKEAYRPFREKEEQSRKMDAGKLIENIEKKLK